MGRFILMLALLLTPLAAWAADEPFSRMESAELHRLLQRGPSSAVIIDTRSAGEYAEAHIDGAVSLPFQELKQDPKRLIWPKDAVMVFYCTGYS